MRKGISRFIREPRTIILIILVMISLAAISTLGIPQGLDLKGGSIIQIQLEKPVDPATMNTITSVLDKRLNIFGVKDVKVRASGNQNVIIEIAGVKPEEVARIVGSPGKFEAKIDNKTVLTGADIVSVQSPIIRGNQWEVPFRISPDGAKRFAEAAEGKAGAPVDMYLDDRLITSPEISPDVAAGKPVTDVAITGAESTRESAELKAKEVETLLKSGSLPVKVKIVGVSSVSAELGGEFTKGAIIAGLIAIIAIIIILIARYRTPVLVLPIFFTTLAELILILGVAAIIRWNIDLAAIAGILAAIGTGVDDQIIITDEVLGEEKVKRRRRMFRIREAFFIIFASAGTLIAAMLPLAYVGFSRGATGIGMLAGFAFTTVLGVLIGVFITRPVYAKFMEYIIG
ncbi:MAG TPA: MMPL family transporter [Methanothermobacter sp.]|uniref:Protein-export membrane protein SecD n=1 Tax=Methanothermobacter tenebrarum TaxID=680118 RepID=A0ABM7YCT6_9EURY|nr:MMPL family transporter [Methanothermobacter tenebrarum]MDD3454834.1 MMPL family transporter [Methanobacteriales archaeon]MDI6881851.1 MMPL family transporter [Methanothermobacter sp.]BDH79150.1 preprotein translocase subunit SecD [Methanothermobacter tenebrarum]HHW17227.1 MMPL family transporter [Methanothermobacter sp.]HOQ19537.1 MMPL family transporter [Methanothermobacter sp.]